MRIKCDNQHTKLLEIVQAQSVILPYLQANILACHKMLREDMRSLGQKQRTLLLTAKAVDRAHDHLHGSLCTPSPMEPTYACDRQLYTQWVELQERNTKFGDLPLSSKQKQA